MPMTLLSSRIPQGMCQKALDLERSIGGERTESKCRKDEDYDLWYGPRPSTEFRSFHVPSVTLEWAATAFSATAASTECTRNAVGSSTTKDPDYKCTRCQGTAHPLDRRPQKSKLEQQVT